MAARADQGRRPILREDYRPPAWLVEHVDLDLRLAAEETEVTSSLHVRRNPQAEDARAPLTLQGSGLKTLEVRIDGEPVSNRQLSQDGETLVVGGVPDQARVTTTVRIRPRANTALEGLYASGDSLLTQCEAEGFRKITWFPDRPDVMSTFRVRLEADRETYPLLLSNGNEVASGELPEGRHYVTWDDPFPKPSYLFALVAGRLAGITDEFVTASGRKVALKLYSEPDNLDQLDYAMESLKRAMAWDEQRFGLEYDLDVYHIVATHDFNMGAMENKGLNIFNSRYVLADRDTATDADFEAVEAVIGHEYFHNWTGNRVTCRDWFQLTLKEGLTVFRDQEFTSDLRSRPVKRIGDVADLMARQFPEDAGPMAHSIRPERYVEINNFYTATVYEKGAEVVRMYQTLLGREGFRRGMDLYFERHDGQAVTCDEFLAAMADANGRDLRQFARWYAQVGTPTLKVERDYDAENGETILRFHQSLMDHPDNRDLGPLKIPVRVGFLGSDNQPLPVRLANETEGDDTTRLLVLTRETSEFRFADLPKDALPSVLRDYSAPVNLKLELDEDELARLAGHDEDAFNRWFAGRRLAERVLEQALDQGDLPASANRLLEAWGAVLSEDALDPALAAELLCLPSLVELAQTRDPVDIVAIHDARQALLRQLVDGLESAMLDRYQANHDPGDWSGDGEAAARRALKNTLLGWLNAGGSAQGQQLAVRQFESANCMTDRLAALRCLVHGGHHHAGRALETFEAHYRHKPLVMDKWFTVQATMPAAETAEQVARLAGHPAFSLKNPNKVRALFGALAMANPLAFHRVDGKGYRLIGATVRKLDDINPQVAARVVTAFNRWRAFEPDQSEQMRAELDKIAAKRNLSPDVGEIVSAALRKRPN